MKTHLNSFVESGEVPGFVSLVSKDDRVEIEVAGVRTQKGAPLTADSIFRITSMTKPIAVAATLRLVSQGKFGLHDPIENFLPELANRRVLKRFDGPLSETVPANRKITVEDLLTFRMGFGMRSEFFSNRYPVTDRFEMLELIGLGAPDLSSSLTYDEWLKRFATLPLMMQPGEMWQYGTAYYLLGVYLSRATGKPLDELFQELVFSPLGMKDTGFVVPREKLERFTDCYWFDSENQRLQLYDSAVDSLWSRKPAFLDAAAGLVSTAGDYLAFAKMLMNHGKHNGTTFLSAEMIQAMTQNQLTPEQRARPTFDPDQWKNHGFGYGVAVLTSEAPTVKGRVGQYGWNGGFGSSWMNDPQENLIGIIMCERTFDSPALPPICEAFWNQVYGRA